MLACPPVRPGLAVTTYAKFGSRGLSPQRLASMDVKLDFGFGVDKKDLVICLAIGDLFILLAVG